MTACRIRPPDVELREVAADDLDAFFEHQLDPEANRMAAFTSRDAADRNAFDAHWVRILRNEAITKRTILSEGRVAGHVVRFERFGKPEVSYWLGKEYWGRGLATRALSTFLAEVPERPLYARAATDNLASIRVLEKCGFRITGRERAFAQARGEEIDEAVLILE